MDDREIVKCINSGEYSKLTFLHDVTLLESNENYYGFLYFTLDVQGESNESIFADIVKTHGGEANAYLYLGRVARRVFLGRKGSSIANCFFRRALEFDACNANALCEIYFSTYDLKSLLAAIKISISNGDFYSVNDMLSKINHQLPDIATFTEEESYLLIDKLNNNHLENCYGKSCLLMYAYYIVGAYSDCIVILNELEHIDLKFIKLLYAGGIIDKDLAVSKIFDFQLAGFFDYNYSALYNYLEENNKCESLKLAKVEFLKCAFIASKYEDVISFYKKECECNNVFNLEPNIYYLLALLNAKKELDCDVLKYVSDNIDISHEGHALYKIFVCKNTISVLYKELEKDSKPTYDIKVNARYQYIEKILEEQVVIEHFLYDDVCNSLEELSHDWMKSYYSYMLGELGGSYNDKLDDLIMHCHYKMNLGEYDYVIKTLEDYHSNNTATIITNNMLGVCFTRVGDDERAFIQYENAMKIMRANEEYHYTIISNYLTTAKMVNAELKQSEYEILRDKFNLCLLADFKWGRYLSANGSNLYKYFPLNINSIDSLVNQYFYFPNKEQLNDPIEMPNVNGVGDDSLIGSEYRICSFSKNDNSMLMWSHYTNNHSGFMVEYEFDDGIPKGVGIDEVKYTNNEKRNKEQDKYVFNQYLLTKNHEWHYEKEVRLISYNISKIFYGEYKYPNPDRTKINAKIISITLGCKFPESKIDLIVGIVTSINAKRQPYDVPIIIRKAKISKDNIFDLEYENI